MRFRVLLQKALLIGLSLALFAPSVRVIAQEAQESTEESFLKIYREAHRLFYQGDYEAAKQKFREAFLIGEKIPGKIHYDELVGGLKMEGLCYQYLDELDQALALFYEALRMDEVHGEKDVSDSLNVIGWAHYLKGEYNQAIDYLQRAEAVCDKDIRAGGLRARILIDMGVVYSALGNYSLAYKYLQDGVGLTKTENQRRKQESAPQIEMEPMRGLQHLGNLERSWGNFAKALDHYEEAVRVGREAWAKPFNIHLLFNRAYLVDALIDLGTLYGRRQEYSQAQAAFEEALTMSRQWGTRRLMARSLLNLGNLARERGSLQDALAYHQQALTISEEVALRPMMGMALAELGWDWLQMGNPEQALQVFQRAVDEGAHALPAEVNTRIYSGLAEAYETLKDWEKAADYYRLTIDSIEKVQLGLLTEDRKIRYWQTKQTTFERAITLLHRLHQEHPETRYDAEAFAYVERARARAFLDLLAEAKVRPSRGLSPEVQQEEQAISHKIARIQKKLLQEDLSPAARTQLETDLRRAEEQFQEFQQRVRVSYPAYAALQYPQPLNLAQVQQAVLTPDTLLLEFMLGDRQSFLWAISKEHFQMVALPGRAEIEQQVKRYRLTITSPPSNKQSFDRCFYRASQLYEVLLKPVEKTLNQYVNLIIVPDGILHYLPFETLLARPVKGGTTRPQFLLSTHCISYASSASALGLIETRRLESRRKNAQLLAYADPVFRIHHQDTKGTKTGQNNAQWPLRRSVGRKHSSLVEVTRSLYRQGGIHFDPLPYTRAEVESIAALYPKTASRVYLGLAATESSLKREHLAQFSQLHFATHGLIDEEVPARSGIVFSLVGEKDDDGILQMNEIFDLDLKADLVVLSACQTGLGKLVRGEGMIGLTRAFMYAGADSVVVSLWNVRDSSTAEFMKSFYRHLKEGKPKAEALRQAKLEMLRSEIPAYRHPYFWAAFVLVGGRY